MKPVLSFDALTLHAVADELRTGIVGGQVQKVVLVDPRSLGLEVYARGERVGVLISTDPQAARVCLTGERPARGSEAVTPLLLLLRKYVRDARVEGLEQPPLERIVELRLSKRDDGGSLREVRLIIEVMGRRSNAVLVSEDGTILDALRRAAPAKNPGRPILPHLRYQPPPPQRRLDPWAADTWDRLPELADGRPDGPLAELLAGELRGFSPLLAREAGFRATGRLDAQAGAADWPAVRAVVGELLAPARGEARWAPSVARRGGGVVAFAPYRLRHLESACEVVDVESMSAAVELGYARPPTAGPAPTATALARPLVEAIDARRALVERRRAALARAREAAGDPDEPRVAGQAILAAAHSIRPGQESLEVEGRRIRLDPRESAPENAQRYFREYRKAREAARRVPELLERADRELEHLDDMRTLAELASDPDRVRALREELRSSGILQDRAPRARKGSPVARAKPLSVPLSDGFVALVGTSARSNEEVTFDLAGQDDVWLHARRLPGAHVIVRTGGRPLPRHVLLEAAGLAAHFSRGREAGRVAIDWTLRRHVRKIRGGPPGLVSYVEEKSVEVPPRAPDARR